MNSGLWVGATAPALAGPRLLRRRGVDPLGAALGDLRPCEWQNSAAAKTHRKKSITSSGADASAAPPPDASLKQVGLPRDMLKKN